MNACCNHDCNQGRDCPARRCDALGVCQGLTPSCEGCTPLAMANSDGSGPQAATPWGGWDWIDRLHTPLVWALLWVLVVGGSAASVLCLLLAYTGGALCAR